MKHRFFKVEVDSRCRSLASPDAVGLSYGSDQGSARVSRPGFGLMLLILILISILIDLTSCAPDKSRAQAGIFDHEQEAD
jgi:hypothetical protein